MVNLAYIKLIILFFPGPLSLRLRGRLPARPPVGEAVPHLAAVVAARGVGAGGGGQAGAAGLRPAGGNGIAGTR